MIFVATIQQRIDVEAGNRKEAEQILREYPPYIGVFGGSWSIETRSKISKIISLKKVKSTDRK